jgi:hypothetical protein
MNIAQAKEIPLDDLLSWLGFEPAKQVNGELWYKSPFRTDDDTPSFKISASRKAWFDFGDGSTNGGSIIDFALRYYQLGDKDISGALRELRGFSGKVIADTPKQPTQRAGNGQGSAFKKAPEENNVLPFEPPTGHILNFEKEFEVWQGYGKGRKFSPLAQYLLDRGINPTIAAPYICNIGFSPAKQPTKKWYGVGFRNNSGGFEVRAKFGDTGFKTCIGKKDLTFYAAKSQEGEPKPTKTFVFESFLDFLSYLSMFENIDPSKENYLILNGATLANRAIEAFKQNETHFDPLILFTQLDDAGKEVARKFLELTDRTVLTAWHYYEGYKDLNDALKAQKIKPDEPKAKFNPEFTQNYNASFKPKI